jgi:hypothetical protein
MIESAQPMSTDELRGGISKLANDIYISVFARYDKYVNPKASFEGKRQTVSV